MQAQLADLRDDAVQRQGQVPDRGSARLVRRAQGARRRPGATTASSASKRVGVHPPYVPVGNRQDYNFIHGSSVRKNYRFDPCQKISYRLNIRGRRPARRGRCVKAALTQVTWATGIKFRYVGKSKLIPYNMGRRKHYPRGTDLVIAFATHAEVPDFDRRTAAGFGGPSWLHARPRQPAARRVWMTTEAGVTLSTDYWNNGFAHSFFDNTRATMRRADAPRGRSRGGPRPRRFGTQEIMNGQQLLPLPGRLLQGPVQPRRPQRACPRSASSRAACARSGAGG